jgi:hypothetical protein
MPAIMGAFLSRVAEMLGSRNAAAAELARDPYRERPAKPPAAARWLGIAETNGAHVGIDDPLTIAHLKALVWIHRHHEALAAKRRAAAGDAATIRPRDLREIPLASGRDLSGR